MPQVILLSDGSVTRHLQLMTNQRVEVRRRCMGCVTEHMRSLQQLCKQDVLPGTARCGYPERLLCEAATL